MPLLLEWFVSCTTVGVDVTQVHVHEDGTVDRVMMVMRTSVAIVALVALSLVLAVAVAPLMSGGYAVHWDNTCFGTGKKSECYTYCYSHNWHDCRHYIHLQQWNWFESPSPWSP